MPTLEELQAAFDHLADRAPAALATPVRPTHKRRTAVLLVAACTAAVAIGVPVALRSDGGTTRAGSPPAPSPTAVTEATMPKGPFTAALPAPADAQSPDLTYGFAFDGPIAGYTITPDAITRTFQHASIYGPSDPPGGQLWVFYRGAFDPSVLVDRAPAYADGHAGFTGTYAFPNGEGPAPVYAWEYAPDGWAVVFLGVLGADGKPEAESIPSSTDASARAAAHEAMIRRMEFLIATSMTPAHTPLLSPVRVSSSVATRVESVGEGTTSGAIELYDANAGRQWLLKWSSYPLDSADTITIHGHEWDLRSSLDGPSSALLIRDRFGLTITTPSPATNGELEAFAAAIDIADDPSDRSAWFPAATALP